MSNDLKYNTRFAPSNSGNLHCGSVRTAYLNWLAARSTGGKFILRIDDTNADKSSDVYTANIIDTMNWLGLDYDHTFSQSSRFDVYLSRAMDLVNQGKGVYKDGAICLKINDRLNSWTDAANGLIKITDDDLLHANGMVLIKSDGSPTYHFASVVDDIDMGINLIIRGTDHITNTSKHVFLYDALNAPVPKFAHIGLIFDGGKKISKRDGAASVIDMKLRGYHPDAILNLLIKMGWSHPDATFDQSNPLLDKSLALKVFNQGKFRARSSTVDKIKLDWLNDKYNKKQDKIS